MIVVAAAVVAVDAVVAVAVVVAAVRSFLVLSCKLSFFVHGGWKSEPTPAS